MLEEVEEDNIISDDEEVEEKEKSENVGVEDRLSALEKEIENLKKTLEEFRKKKPKQGKYPYPCPAKDGKYPCPVRYPYPTKYPYPPKKSEEDKGESKAKSEEFENLVKSLKEFTEKIEVIDKRLEKIENTPIEITKTESTKNLSKEQYSSALLVDGGIIQEA